MRNPVIVALDVPSTDEALALVHDLASVVGAFKVGKELFVSTGPDIVRAIREEGGEVFLYAAVHVSYPVATFLYSAGEPTKYIVAGSEVSRKMKENP